MPRPRHFDYDANSETRSRLTPLLPQSQAPFAPVPCGSGASRDRETPHTGATLRPSFLWERRKPRLLRCGWRRDSDAVRDRGL